MIKATTKKTTTAKTKATPKPATTHVQASPIAKPTVKPALKVAKTVVVAPKPVVVTQTTPVVSDPALKKKELIETVTERSGIKKKDAKPVIEAMLAFLGETLADGREMNLPTLGKVKINRSKDVQGGKVIIVKVRQSNRVPKSDNDPLASSNNAI